MRDSSLKRSLGVDLTRSLKESRVLLVGAGGIGCELLKNLVLTGFGEIHIIDLDTIDLSNLNRQFLFRHEHIKKSKALIAKEVAQKFRSDTKLEAYHANVMDAQFNISWFGSFNVVFNALDNIAARRHVNKMCLAANVPLIESGTTGFNGQVQVIQKSQTECYDCTPKETPKSFPVCTLRTNPTQPIHCIVWAKSYLLPELFGDSEDEAPEVDVSENADNANEIAELRKEALELKELRKSLGTEEAFQKIFDKVFRRDIIRLQSMEDMWKEREPPELLDFAQLQEESALIASTISTHDQVVWTLAENLSVFRDSLNRLTHRLKQLQEKCLPGQDSPILTFDKDDVDTLDFVTATANLRAAIFHLELKSKFDVKQMAGNIIPAIATTNAMTAGLCVLQSLKVFQNNLMHAKMVFLERSGARAINSYSLNPPNPGCEVCSPVVVRVEIDPELATLEHLIHGVLQMELGYGEEISVACGNILFYDSDFTDDLAEKLSDLGLKNESFITVKDTKKLDARVDIECLLMARIEPYSQNSKPATLQKMVEIPLKSVEPVEPAQPSTDPTATDDATVTGKRKRESSSDDVEQSSHDVKRVASASVPDSKGIEAIVLDDEEGGAIMIDD
ncbi:Ubiquitin-like activating enzyme (UbaB), putative [Penicillium digitatum]|uniref:Ubiquitin-activating enzyme E1-like n=3 Tax=Penicillium digitatum TaxID=36651 RepID=K9G7F9_PEND2|nr:Ubiquitin-like activating enzyme (UbaB), putative [Penicillium digitatum Pd1]EKV15800.1 Ubiquitin-like activating enzyme (UbaB), putative [Penicillium digitatum Pd1]EKV17865.1 Ubiquitin-like activating enzyme (UbaB), putative [Penicillium digitatum PHI26]QQK42329.1 Ubiquitin-like activating enzyme (UbaB), putative [Penicillium digitatum]